MTSIFSVCEVTQGLETCQGGCESLELHSDHQLVQGDLSSKGHSVCKSKGSSSQRVLVEVFP